MKAIILSAGVGSRLGKLTKENPKCLIKIKSKTILEHELNYLLECGINKIILVIGYLGHKIKDFVKEKFPNLDITFVTNPEFDSTNYIYSLWLTKELIDEDIIMLHGDLLFDKSLLNKLLYHKKENCALINKNLQLKKDFKAKIEEDKIKEIGVNVTGENAFFLAPMYKFSKQGFLKWINKIEEFISNGKVNIYAENAFNEISHELILNPIYYKNEFCMEIDTLEDIEKAKKLIN